MALSKLFNPFVCLSLLIYKMKINPGHSTVNAKIRKYFRLIFVPGTELFPFPKFMLKP